MNKNEKVLARVKPISKIGNELVLGCMKITHLVNGKAIKACLLATEYEFIILEKISHESDLQIAERFYWDELFVLSTSDLRITAKTSKTVVEFEIQNASHVCLTMHTCCMRLGGKCRLDSDRIKPQSPTPLWNLYKFKYSLFKRGISAPQYLINEIETAIRQNSPILDLNKVHCSDRYLGDVLEAFVDANCFKEVVFPPSENNTNWNIIIPFVKSFKHFETLTFTEKLTNQVSHVANALANNKESRVQGLTFMKSSINADNISYFIQLVSCRKISRLTLIDAVDVSFQDKFITELSKCDAVKSLDSICIRDMPTIPADLLMKSFKSVKTFEFHNCQVVVDSLFPYLSNNNLCGIIVDGGTVIGKGLDKIPISASISNFTFSHIKWDNYSFISMWCRILNHSPQNDYISMDLSYSQAGPQVWHSFFQAYCASPAKSIKSINWSGNQVHPVFLQFCASSQNLSTLQLDGCYTAQTSGIMVANFAELMKSNNYISELIMRSVDESMKCDSSISRFIDILVSNNGLTSLDLSGQPLGDSGLNSLANMLAQNKKIKKVKYDGALGVNFDTLQLFMQKLSQRGIPIDVEWPFNEIARLRNVNGIPASNVTKLRQIWKSAVNGGKSTEPLTDIEEEPDISPVDIYSGSSSAFDEFSNSPLWKIDLPPIPEPDNSSILQNADSIYSVNELLKMMRKSD